MDSMRFLRAQRGDQICNFWMQSTHTHTHIYIYIYKRERQRERERERLIKLSFQLVVGFTSRPSRPSLPSWQEMRRFVCVGKICVSGVPKLQKLWLLPCQFCSNALRLHTALRTVGVLGMVGSTTCIPIYDVMSYQLVYVFFWMLVAFLVIKPENRQWLLFCFRGCRLFSRRKRLGEALVGPIYPFASHSAIIADALPELTDRTRHHPDWPVGPGVVTKMPKKINDSCPKTARSGKSESPGPRDPRDPKVGGSPLGSSCMIQKPHREWIWNIILKYAQMLETCQKKVSMS